MEYNELPSVKAGSWPTKVMARCRNEPQFEVTIQFQPIPFRGLVPYIDCPHCARVYSLNKKGEWYSDRPLVILSQRQP